MHTDYGILSSKQANRALWFVKTNIPKSMRKEASFPSSSSPCDYFGLKLVQALSISKEQGLMIEVVENKRFWPLGLPVSHALNEEKTGETSF